MNKDISKLIIEITLIIMVVIFTAVLFLTNNTNKTREELIALNNRSLSLNVTDAVKNRTLKKIKDKDLADNLDCDVIEINNNTETTTNYNLVLKITKTINVDNYKIKANSNIYELNKLNYREDDNYYYFTIDTFTISNKTQNITFGIWLKDDSIAEKETFKYSYMIEW